MEEGKGFREALERTEDLMRGGAKFFSPNPTPLQTKKIFEATGE